MIGDAASIYDPIAFVDESILPEVREGWNYVLSNNIDSFWDIRDAKKVTLGICQRGNGPDGHYQYEALPINGEVTIKFVIPESETKTKVYRLKDGKYTNMNAIIENMEEEWAANYCTGNYKFLTFKTKDFMDGEAEFILTSQDLYAGGSSGGTSSGGSSSGGSSSGGSSSGGSSSGGSSSSTSTYLSVTNKTIPNDKNAIADTTRVDAKPGETITNNSGAAVKIAKSDSVVSYVKIDAPTNTAEAANWAEPIVKKADSSKLTDVKKATEKALGAIADNKGFALNVDILNTNRKTVEPNGNVEVTVPVPAAYKGKNLHAYRITERGIIPILATTANSKITFNAGSAGEYIFTTEKLTDALTYEKGNVDLDGKTNAKDATVILKETLI